MALPTGPAVTFLFTDIEGSTRLERTVGSNDWATIVARHDRLLREAIESNGGVVVKTEGDAFFAAFDRPHSATRAAVAAQRALAAEPWPETCRLKVRMGLHLGEGRLRHGLTEGEPEDYVGIDVNYARDPAEIAAERLGEERAADPENVVRAPPSRRADLVSPLETGDDVALQEGEDMGDKADAKPSLPPPWFIRLAWAIHRAIYRLTGGRRGLWRPKPGKWGTMLLTTVGRKTGKERVAILGYLEEGPNLVTMAMNGWMAAEPAWWLNLQARPEASVELKEGARRVRARAAVGEEHDRLWAKWAEIDQKLDGYATRRPGGTAVVILEPVTD